MKKEDLMDRLNILIKPIVVQNGCELYHIEYVKESGENYLRIYIDNEKGISLEDCERVSRPVSDLLDVEDPITESYYLEVSSPGIFRSLYTDKHLEKYKGSQISVKLSGLFNGKKLFGGTLLDFNDLDITIESDNNTISIPREKIKNISLKGSYKEEKINE